MPQVAACPRGTKRARIAGRIAACASGSDAILTSIRRSPSYKRYGFLCTSRASNEPTTLFRIAQPGPAPNTCAWIGPTPTSTPPDLHGSWVAESPFWVWPYLKRDPNVSVWRYAANIGLKGNDGWFGKFIWVLARTVTGPARVSITNPASERPLRSQSAASEARHRCSIRPGQGHPDVASKPDTHEWAPTSSSRAPAATALTRSGRKARGVLSSPSVPDVRRAVVATAAVIVSLPNGQAANAAARTARVDVFPSQPRVGQTAIRTLPRPRCRYVAETRHASFMGRRMPWAASC